MSSRRTVLLALSTTLPLALAACETSGSGELLEDASASIQSAVPPEAFQYTSATQTEFNPFTVDFTQPSTAAGGPAKSFVRVSSPGISIGSPKHEAVAKAVVTEVASERLCQPGTSPQFQQQYGRDVYLNERVQKWGAIVYCDTAPAYSPMQAPAMANAPMQQAPSQAYGQNQNYGQAQPVAPVQNQAAAPIQTPPSAGTPGVFGASNASSGSYAQNTVNMPAAPIPPAPVQDTVIPLPNDNSPLPLSMMSSDGYQ